ncbi:hypothetical protein P7C71_g6540, partial [Lecanoromycetidae sp. Uapishka_2]
MGSMIRVTSLTATTTFLISTIWMALAVAIPVQSILAAPQLVLSNGLNAPFEAPGLGIELELVTLTYASTTRPWDQIDTAGKEALKGARLIPTGFAGGTQTNWKLTSEISPANLMTEIIVDGQKNKVGGDASRRIGQEIVEYMNGWWVFCKERCLATVDPDPVGTNPWEVQWRQPFAQAVFQPQVTAAMPMEGVLQVLTDGKAKYKRDVLINIGQDYNEKIIVVNKASFQFFGRIRQTDINDEFLGFFSLLISYCVAASEGEAAHGPKRGLNIMPRTNFLTMYNKFARDKLQDQFVLGTSLYDIIRGIAAAERGRNLDTSKMKFKWKPQDLRKPIDETWPGKADDMRSGELTVKEFLDTLQPLSSNTPQLDLLMLMDRMVRHGQIGGLEDRMEGVYGARNTPAPIFEFRDLANVNGVTLAARMAEFDQQVIELHAKATHPTLGTYNDKQEHPSSSDSEIEVLMKPSPDQQEAGQEKYTKSGHQGQRLKAT